MAADDAALRFAGCTCRVDTLVKYNLHSHGCSSGYQMFCISDQHPAILYVAQGEDQVENPNPRMTLLFPNPEGN